MNGKLYPFLQMNEGSVEDYIELQRMMFMLNQNYRSKSFNVFGHGAVANSFREVVTEFESTDANTNAVGDRLPSVGSLPMSLPVS
ncbi:MAG: hypothetical protein AABN34_03630 [Acidobacteriota bacterium]